ncbi:hypothetical protein [Nocardioides acrostichi]|uniref:hypothetical protein n=1 Tax=Nocardioides acrostichi TaxID=2784339 RepID=UPI0038B2DA03
MAFLAASGVLEADAQMAMLAASRYTVGCVLEEQADGPVDVDARQLIIPHIDHDAAFEAGLTLILHGLVARLQAQADSNR